MKRTAFLVIIFLLFIVSSTAQQNVQLLKQEAVQHMEAARFGEALDLLNKVITSQPRIAENYYLRAKCFENRNSNYNAIVDFRRAINLLKSDRTVSEELRSQINAEYNNLLTIWHAEINKRINGYKREIAINPNNAFNYLEIGKNYRLLEEWKTAEEWYDQYLSRDDNPSPDEIIRYTEILAKTKSIKKGEIVLKKFTLKYPEDWRLWSKYGYFTMWVGNYKNAQKAFEQALSFKPYFTEALEGLEQAKRKPYVRVKQKTTRKKEYAIDRYYRILKKNPANTDIRYKLIDELIDKKRIEEAFQQLQFLSKNPVNQEKFDKKLKFVTNYRDSLYQLEIQDLQNRVELNPNDKDAIKKLAEYYEYLEDYESAIVILDTYLTENPNETDTELLYRYARLSAWIKEFDRALEIMDKILATNPDNLDYQMFKAQILIWTPQQLDVAESLLDKVYAKRPNSIDVIVSFGSLRLLQDNPEAAQELCNKAKEINPSHQDALKLQSNIDFYLLRAEEEKTLVILEEGRQLFLDSDCKEALKYYEKYLEEATPTNLLLKEYGDVNFCAENYDKALEIYQGILADGYDYDVALMEAKAFFAKGDSLKAVEKFEMIVQEEPDDFESNLFLCDAYTKAEIYDSAKAVVERLRAWDLDSAEIAMVNLRETWIPVTGIMGTIEAFPAYVGFAPTGGFYTDNLGFRLLTYGGRLELGINRYLAIGASFYKSQIYKNSATRDYNSFKGHIFLNLSYNFRADFGYGVVNTPGFDKEDEIEANVDYLEKDLMRFTFSYKHSYSGILLYTSSFVDFPKQYKTDHYKLSGSYLLNDALLFKGYFQYLRNTDENEGNSFQLKPGYFLKDYLLLGYEFYYSNYKFESKLYYTPIDFESHSAWADWIVSDTERLQFTFSGKLGIVSAENTNIIRELGLKTKYKPAKNFTLEGELTVGSTVRQKSTYASEDPTAAERTFSYSFASGRISIFWNLW
ncbi:MAG: tetratricopeptide repeat protein [Rhodothermaceae bacterium]